MMLRHVKARTFTQLLWLHPVSFLPSHREGAETMYFFSSLALTLNELEEGVAPTDSRRRPDQRLMEEGHWDEANAEKQRLEEKQRIVRREREREAVKAANSAEEGNSSPHDLGNSKEVVGSFKGLGCYI